MSKSGIITTNADLVIFGKTISRDMVFYVDNCSKISEEPLLVSFSLPKKSPGLEVIDKAREFVIHFVDQDFLERHKESIKKLTKYEDPKKTLGLTFTDSVKLDCPRLERAQTILECEKVKQMEMGDGIVFIGHVLHKE